MDSCTMEDLISKKSKPNQFKPSNRTKHQPNASPFLEQKPAYGGKWKKKWLISQKNKKYVKMSYTSCI